MKRPVLLIATSLSAVLLSAGAALAANIACDGGPCNGTNRADTMRGSGSYDRMAGRGGHDRMNGGGGPDVMYGGLGGDTVAGAAGNDRIYGGALGDTLAGGFARDRIFGGEGVDTIYGGPGDDYIVIAGDRANDFVNCGTGSNDVVVLDAQEQIPANPNDFIAQSDCEFPRPRP